MPVKNKSAQKRPMPRRPAEPQSPADQIAHLKTRIVALQTALEQTQQERDALAKEMLTPQVFQRLLDWLRNPKPASAAFTAGIERQIAYALEMDVLPEVKSLRIRLANAEKRNSTGDAGASGQDIPLTQSVEAAAQAFEATLSHPAERVPSPVYPCGWCYRDAAIQWQFREFCTARTAATGAAAPDAQ